MHHHHEEKDTDSYAGPQAVREALARMDITIYDFAAFLTYTLHDPRPPDTVLRRAAKFASTDRALDTPWPLAALVRLMEMTQHDWKPDLPRARKLSGLGLSADGGQKGTVPTLGKPVEWGRPKS
jgi:hypothetical protein